MRRLTLLGKIVVLKSLIASQLVYILSPLPTNHSAINEIYSMFFNFLWDGKGDKIRNIDLARLKLGTPYRNKLTTKEKGTLFFLDQKLNKRSTVSMLLFHYFFQLNFNKLYLTSQPNFSKIVKITYSIYRKDVRRDSHATTYHIF